MFATVTLHGYVFASEYFACQWLALEWLIMQREIRGENHSYRIERFDGTIYHEL